MVLLTVAAGTQSFAEPLRVMAGSVICRVDNAEQIRSMKGADTIQVESSGSTASLDYTLSTNNGLMFDASPRNSLWNSSTNAMSGGSLQFELRVPAFYRTEGGIGWTGSTIELARQFFVLTPYDPTALYSESDFSLDRSGQLGLQGQVDVGSGSTQGSTTGWLDPGVYAISFEYILDDYLRDAVNDSVLTGGLKFAVSFETNNLEQVLGQAIEFPVIARPQPNPWFRTFSTSHDGVDSARSGMVEQGESSTLAVNMTGPGILSFWWKVSSWTNGDPLEIKIDGVPRARITGERPWERRAMAISEGDHVVEWTFSKLVTFLNSTNAGWIDRVEFLQTNAPALAQEINFGTITQLRADMPAELNARATSFLPVTYQILEGPALIQGNVVFPLGPASVKIRATQNGDAAFLPAMPKDVLLTFATGPTNPIAANVPGLTAGVGGHDRKIIEAIAFQADGKIIIGGCFSEVAGFPRTNLARFNADGTVDQTWSPRVEGGRGVLSLAIRGNDLFVGGEFSEVNGLPRRHLAKISLIDGSVDSVWAPDPDGIVTCIVGNSDSLFAGGYFGFIGRASRRCVAKLSMEGAGNADPLWDAKINDSVRHLALSGTNVFAAGLFTRADTVEIATLVKVNTVNGAMDTRWRPGITGVAAVRSLIAEEGSVYFATELSALPGNFDPITRLFRVSATDGHLDAAAGGLNQLTALAVNGDSIYAAVGYNSDPVWGTPAVLKFDKATLNQSLGYHAMSTDPFPRDGAGWPAEITRLAFHGNDLFAVGDFKSLAGSPGSGIAIMPVFEAPPRVTQGATIAGRLSNSGLEISPAAADMVETTFYRISGVQHGQLYKRGDTNSLGNGAFITRAEGAAGLRFMPDAGFTGVATFQVQSASTDHPIAVSSLISTGEVTVLEAPLPQTISYRVVGSIPYQPGVIPLDFTATSGLPIQFEVFGPAALEGNALRLTGPGEVTVLASQAGSDIYLPAQRVGQIIVVLQGVQHIAFAPITDPRTFGVVELSATSDAGLPIRFSVLSGPATISSNLMTFIGAGEVKVRAFQEGNNLYGPAFADQTLTVQKAAQTIQFATVSERPFNAPPVRLAATASSGLTVSISVKRGGATLQGDLLTASGAGDVEVEARQAGNGIYSEAIATQTITFLKASQQTLFDPIQVRPFTNRTDLANASINLAATSSSGLPVSFRVASGPGSVAQEGARPVLKITNPGTITIEANQSGSSNFLAAPAVSQTVVIPKLAQTINFPLASEITFTPFPIPLDATASSQLPVEYAIVSGPATVQSNTLVMGGSGQVMIAAYQNGDLFYGAAPAQTNSARIVPTSQTIEFTLPTSAKILDVLALTAAANSSLPVEYSIVSGPGLLISNTLRFSATGTVAVAANQPGTSGFNPAPAVVRTVLVTRASQPIVFSPISDRPWTSGPVQVTATSQSNIVTLELVAGKATLANSTLSLSGAGTVTLRARSAGNAIYESAESLYSFVALPVAQSIQFPPPGDVLFSNNPLLLKASSSSGLPLTFTVTGPAELLPPGDRAKLNGIGTVIVRAAQKGNADYLPASPVEQSFRVQKGVQTITFNLPATGRVGERITLEAVSDSGLPVEFGIAFGAGILSSNSLTAIDIGGVVVVAMQFGNETYEAAAPVERVVSITKGSQTITLLGADQVFLEDGSFTVNATSSAGLPVRLAILSGPATISGNVITPLATGDIRIRAFEPGNEKFEAAVPIERSILVRNKGATLAIDQAGGVITLKWAAGAATYRLETSGSLRVDDWTMVQAAQTTSNNEVVVRFTPASPSFFRLRKNE